LPILTAVKPALSPLAFRVRYSSRLLQVYPS